MDMHSLIETFIQALESRIEDTVIINRTDLQAILEDWLLKERALLGLDKDISEMKDMILNPNKRQDFH